MKCEHCGEEVGEFYGHLDEHIWKTHKDKIWEDWWNRMLNSKNTIAETYKLSVEGGYPKTFLGMLEEFRQDWFKFKEYHAVGGSKNNETQEIKTYKRKKKGGKRKCVEVNRYIRKKPKPKIGN